MHEGHRRRMYERVKNGDKLYEHELLEILLYTAYPRKNTNPVAHALLNRFSSISAIFKADVEELCEVEGVGENIALYLKTVGLCARAADESECFARVRTRGDLLKFVSARFSGKKSEFLEFYGMDRNGRVNRIYSYTSDDLTRVDVATAEITRIISRLQPYAMFMAHNHLKGTAAPSQEDDRTTEKCMQVCRVTGTQLYDHLIYASDDEVFSYSDSGRLASINRYLDGKMI